MRDSTVEGTATANSAEQAAIASRSPADGTKREFVTNLIVRRRPPRALRSTGYPKLQPPTTLPLAATENTPSAVLTAWMYSTRPSGVSAASQ